MKIYKKALVLIPCIFFISTSTYFVHAEDYHQNSYAEDLYNATQDVTQEQYLKNFMLELFNPFIVEATQEYYKDKSATGLSFHWEDNYNVVEITQPVTQGKDSKYPFIVKFTVNVYKGDVKNHETLGTDTLTFGIHPYLIGREEIKGFPTIKLIKYKHREPKT
jgi:hypothetical protein